MRKSVGINPVLADIFVAVTMPNGQVVSMLRREIMEKALKAAATAKLRAMPVDHGAAGRRRKAMLTVRGGV